VGLRQRLLTHHRRMPIRWRLTAWILLIMVIVTAVGGVVAVKLIERRFIDSIDDDMRKTSEQFATAYELIDSETLTEIAERGFGETSEALLVLTADGIEFELPSGGPDDPDPLPDISGIPFGELRREAGEPFEIDGSGDVPHYRLLTGQLTDGRLIVVATPLDGLERALKALVGVLLLVAVMATIVLAIVVAVVAGYVTRPLEGMIATAEGIGSGALDKRIQAEGVDDVARLAGALNAMLDRLQGAFDERAASEQKLRQFVADASHELRTPLSAVLGYAELVQTGMAGTPEEVDHAVSRIAAEGDRMRLLVEELLMLARLDHGRPADLTTVDAGDIAAAAVNDATAIAPAWPISLDRDTGDLRVVVDPTSLRQAIDNLLANTRAHTPEGTRVAVTVARRDGDVVIVVDDEGPGIDEVDVEHVFDRFFRSERSRARPGGSGLGLSIVAAVAESHGGTVRAERAPSGGARFTITLSGADVAEPVEQVGERPGDAPGSHLPVGR